MLYKRKNINETGLSFISIFLKNYDIECKLKLNSEFKEDYAKNDIDKFLNVLNELKDKYIYNQTYKTIKEKYNKIIEERDNNFEEFLEEKLKMYKENFEYQLSLYKMQNKSQYENEIYKLKEEIENQKKINEKWKAMFTEQAVANAKLINNGGE